MFMRIDIVFISFQAEEVQFVILVLCPSEIKMTKTALETGRTFSTLFADITLRHDLLEADTVPAFKEIIRTSSEDFAGLGTCTIFLCHFVQNYNLPTIHSDLSYALQNYRRIL